MARRALLTGATGGLGAALAKALLEHGYALRATGRNAEAGRRLAASGATFILADLTDDAAVSALCDGVDVVFHAAALSSPWGRKADFEAINVTATRRLLSAARAAGCEGFVYISTPSVYAQARDCLGLTEDSPLAAPFANDYVATKFAGERLVLAEDCETFTTTALRPRALVGPQDRQLLPRILRVARSGRFPLFHGGRALIELTDARDAAEAVVAADQVQRRAGGQVFNISGGAPRPVADMLRLTFAEAGLNPRLVHVPYPVAASLCRLAEAICSRLAHRPEPPATVYSLSTLAFSQTFDLTKAEQILGWRARFSPEQAIVHAIREGGVRAAL